MRIGMLVILFVCSSIYCWGQTLPQLYIHTDRGAYFPGDTIWFKAYVLRDGLLDNDSRNLYVSLGTSNGQILQQSVMLLQGGTGASHVIVPPNFKENALIWNAYTTKIAAYKEYYYVKTIPIIQEQQPAQLKIPPGSDKQTQSVSPLAPLSNISHLQGYDNKKKAAEVTIQQLNDTIKIIVKSKDINTYRLGARINYRKLFEQEIRFSEVGQKTVLLRQSDLESGLLQVSLRDSLDSLHTHGARLIGPISGYSIRPKVELLEQSLEPKGKNLLQISLPGEESAQLSISITDIDMPLDTVDNIVGDMYLKPFVRDLPRGFRSSLSGNLNDGNVPPGKLRSLDFNVIEGIPDRPDTILNLKGQIEMDKRKWNKFYARYQSLKNNNKKSKMGARGISFGYKKVKDKNMRYIESYPDAQGRFSIPGLSFSDSLETRFSQIYSDLKFENYKVSYRFREVSLQSNLVLPAQVIHEDKNTVNKLMDNKRYYYGPDYFIDNNGIRHIREVPIYRTKRQKRLDALENKYTSGFFKRKAEFVFDPQHDERVVQMSVSLLEYLKTNIRRRSFGSIFLNGWEMTDPIKIDELLETDLSQFEYIKYYDFFPLAYNRAATCIYQLAPNDVDTDFGKQIYEETVGGYLSQQLFFNKLYQTKQEQIITDFDYRPTLYWEPYLHVSAPQTIPFYNNSRAMGFCVTVQGVTRSGNLVFYQAFFKR